MAYFKEILEQPVFEIFFSKHLSSIEIIVFLYQSKVVSKKN